MKFFPFLIALFVALGSTYSNTWYLDPVNGALSNEGTIEFPWSSIAEVIEANYIISNNYAPLPYVAELSTPVPKNIDGYISPGDTLMLMDGLHGSISLRNYINDLPITVIAVNTHAAIIEYIDLVACKNWTFDGLSISTEPYEYYSNDRLFFIESHGHHGPASHITINNCKIYSTTQPWNEAQDWVEKSSYGLIIQGDSVIATNNLIENVDMGLFAVGNYIKAENNVINNFSGDGMRCLGSNILFKSNLIKNCYKVDGNHDDGIQSYTTNGLVVNNNQIISNVIINTDDPSRPLNGPLQGIGCFDGFYDNWLIANNLIVVDHYHGISLYGARNCRIINNTVIDPSPDLIPGPIWIRITDHKDGTPSSGCIVANNVSNKIIVDASEINNVTLDTYAQYSINFVDHQKNDFHLKLGSILIDAGNSEAAPAYDLENNPRYLDESPDIGAYEYIDNLNSANEVLNEELIIYPNPFSDQLRISMIEFEGDIEIYNVSGQLVIKTNYGQLNESLCGLLSGTYIFVMRSFEGNIEYSKLLSKI